MADIFKKHGKSFCIYINYKTGAKPGFGFDDKILVVGEHNFKDNQDVSGLYEVRWQCLNDEWADCDSRVYAIYPYDRRRTVAVAKDIDAMPCEHCHGYRGHTVDCSQPSEPQPASLKVEAQELVDKFHDVGGLDRDEAKQCALICVNFIFEQGLTFLGKKYDELQSLRSAINKL